jgi:DNA-binding HxlR family transcriptional regulator
MIDFRGKVYRCPVELTIDLLGGKWKAVLLWELSVKMLRFNELTRLFPNATRKMLTQQLKEMERDGIINRKEYYQMPPKVEYSLTDFGRTFMPVLFSMNQWGEDYIIRMQKQGNKSE